MKNIQKVTFEKAKVSVKSGDYCAGDGIAISRDNKVSIKAGSGLSFNASGALEVKKPKIVMQENEICRANLIGIISNCNGYLGLSKDKSKVYFSADLNVWKDVSSELLSSIVYVASLAGKFVAFKYVNVEGIGTRLYVYYSLDGINWIDEGLYYTDTFAFDYLKAFGSDFSQFWYVIRRNKHTLHIASNGLNFAPIQTITDAILNNQQSIKDVCFNGDSFIFLDSAKMVAFLPRNASVTTKYNRVSVDFLLSCDVEFLKYGNGLYCFASSTQNNGIAKVYFARHLVSGAEISSIDLGDVHILDLIYSKYSKNFYALVKKNASFEVYSFDSSNALNYKSVLVVNAASSDTQSFFYGSDGQVGVLYNYKNGEVEGLTTYLERSLFLQ